MASDSFLSLKVSDLEILSYENAETWFTKMQAVLDGKEIWYPVQDIYLIRQGLDPLPDVDEDDDFFLPPRASLSPAPRRTIPTSTPEPSIETSATTEVEKIRKLWKKAAWKKANKLAIAVILGRISPVDINIVKRYMVAFERDPDQKILAAVNEVRHLAGRIPELGGDPPSEEMMIVVLLKGLLPKYETFRQTLMLQDLSFNQAVESLKTAESTLPTTAAEAPSYTDFANRTKERIKCYGCGKYGHVRKDCPEESDKEKRPRSKKITKLKKEQAKIAKQIAKLELSDSDSDSDSESF
ncbi:hypothetical protein BDW60DRAFT_212482 [Aspergillus nidulans var. acristatus]